MKTTTDASASTTGWAVAMSTAGLDNGAPQVTVLQARTPRQWASAQKCKCPQKIPRTTRTQKRDTGKSKTNSYRVRGGAGNDKSPHDSDPKEILAPKVQNFQKPPQCALRGTQRVGNGYCEYHRQKGHTTNECVQLRQLIDKLVKEGRLDHLVKNIKEGKDKQRSGGKKDAPRDKADTIYMVQSWQRKTKQKVSQKFSHGSSISFPTLTADNAVVGAITIEINAGHESPHVHWLGEHCRHTVRTLLPKMRPE
ncbi:hypothetical protein Tco_0670313 [Tanacetum coccineum]